MRWMPTFILLILILTAGSEPAPAAPLLSRGVMRTDFGLIRQGQKITRVFTLANTGSNPVTIFSVTPSLGTVDATIDRKVIEPGQTAALSVQYDSRNGMGATDA